MQITIAEARTLAASVLEHCPLSERDRVEITNHLLSAEVRGHSTHGLTQLPSIVSSLAQSSADAQRELVKDAPGFVFLDGKKTQGIAAVADLLRLAASRVAESGAVVAAVSDFVGITGCLGVYGAELAEKSLSAIQFCHSEYGVAPYGAAQAILGTNPIAFSMPGSAFSFVADVATSAWSYGALKEAMDAGRRIPKGIVQTADGKPSTDPHDAGSQLPMAGHKGYALGLAIELFCGPLLGGKAGHTAVPGSLSYIAVVINTGSVRPVRQVVHESDQLFSEILGAPLAEGFKQVRIPGERACELEKSTTSISITKDLFAKLSSLGGR